jgi:hypothetical protein
MWIRRNNIRRREKNNEKILPTLKILKTCNIGISI